MLCNSCEEVSGEAPKARHPKILTFQMACGGGTFFVGSLCYSRCNVANVSFQCMFLYKSKQCSRAGSHERASQKPPRSVVPYTVSLAFPTVSYLCLHEGLEALDFVMSHFLAISLRTRELPHLSAGTETSSGGRMGCALLPVLPVSQGPGEANWGLSLVAVLFRWVK